MQKTFAFAYYPAFDALPPNTRLQPYFDWWRSIVAREGRPSRKSVGFADLRGWHSRLTLCRVLADRSDMVVHIVGEEVKDLYNSHGAGGGVLIARGTHMRALIEVTKEAQRRHLAQILDGPSIAITRGRLRLINGRNMDVFAIDFPLAPLGNEEPYILTLYDFDLDPLERGLPNDGWQTM
ncbi:MAG: hypothetical protein Tsb008_22640 [Rhodothalassiaceae bacterium]